MIHQSYLNQVYAGTPWAAALGEKETKPGLRSPSDEPDNDKAMDLMVEIVGSLNEADKICLYNYLYASGCRTEANYLMNWRIRRKKTNK